MSLTGLLQCFRQLEEHFGLSWRWLCAVQMTLYQLAYHPQSKAGRQAQEGRRRKAEGGRQKAEGRRQKAEGGRQKGVVNVQEEERELTASRRAKRRRSEPGWNSKARSRMEIFFSAMPACTPRRPLPDLYKT